MEELSRINYKLCKIAIKYIPISLAMWSFFGSILSCLGITINVFEFLFGTTVVPVICVILFSKLLKFCIWHRLPLYYSLLIDLINIIDFYFTIPISNKWMIVIYLIVSGTFIIVGSYLKNKSNKRGVLKNV